MPLFLLFMTILRCIFIVMDKGKLQEASMAKQKLNYRFHNPNPTAVTVRCLLEILIEVNSGKAERAIENIVNRFPDGERRDDRCV